MVLGPEPWRKSVCVGEGRVERTLQFFLAHIEMQQGDPWQDHEVGEV